MHRLGTDRLAITLSMMSNESLREIAKRRNHEAVLARDVLKRRDRAATFGEYDHPQYEDALDPDVASGSQRDRNV